jgi:hypothetical protein
MAGSRRTPRTQHGGESSNTRESEPSRGSAEPDGTNDRESDTSPAEQEARSATLDKELELARERRIMMEMMVTMSQQIEDLKRGRSATLDAANPNPAPTKRKTIFKPAPHTKLYSTTTYEACSQYTAKVATEATMCQMTDEETVIYARAGITYTEQNLWDDYCKKPNVTGSWEDCKAFLLIRLGNPENRIRDAWRSFFSLRKRADETDYQWMDRWQEKAREIGPDFDNLEEYRRNQFLWQFDRPMRDKLDELADLPHTIRDIAATATRLRPNIAVGKSNPLSQTDSSHGKDKRINQQLSRKDYQLQQSNSTDPWTKNSANTTIKDQAASATAKNSPDLPQEKLVLGKDRDTLSKEGRCFTCGSKEHMAAACPNKKA